MSAQSIRIPIELELKNIQGAISSLKSALSSVSKNSGLYSDLSKEIDKVEKKFLTLQATASRPFFKTSEISSFGNQFLKLGDNITSISERFKNINFKDLDLSKIAGAQEKFNELQKKVEETSGKVQNFMNSEFQKASSSGGELFDVIQKMETAFKGQNLKLDTNSFENSCNIINSKMQEIIRKKEQLDQKLNEQQNKQQNSLSKYESFKDVKKDIESFKNLTDVNNFITKYDEKAKTLNKGMTGEEYLKAYFGIDLTEIKKAGADLEAEKNKILTSKNFVSQSNAATKDFLRSADLVESTQYQIDEFQRLIGVLQQVGTAFNTFQNDANRQTAFQKSQEEAEKARIAFDNYKLTILESSGVLGNASGATLSFSSALGSLQGKISQAEAKLHALNEQSRKMEQMKSRIAMWFGFTRIMNTVRRTITNAVNEIRELDKVMTEISVVTKMSQEDLWGQIKAYSEIANQYGVSTRGVYEVSQLYYQQGLQTAEVMQLTTETLKMAKIASLDYATATDYMTVAIRGFKMEMEDAQVVTDVYSALAAGTASNTEELAVAMSKTASSAEAVGSSFESTSAMIATMIATTREAPENIGSAMKSIISRYGEMTSDPTKLVDSEGEEMSLNRVDKALRSVGITLQDVNGEFRDFDDVILELAKSWDTIDTNTQRYIATVMAGNRQQSRFLALVGNYEEYARALDIAENAEDTGTLQALKTMDSLETKIQGVKTAWEQFYNSMGIEKMFKGVLGTVTKIINNLSKMSKPAAFGTIINLFKGIKTLITGISNGITGTFQKMQGNAQNTIGNLKSQLSTLQEIQNINLGDENAHAKLNALIQKLRSLGANIPLSVSTNKSGVPTVTSGGNFIPNSSTTTNQTYNGAYAGMLAYMQANPQAYDNLLNGAKDKSGNSVTSHGMIGEWLAKEGYVSNKKEGRKYSNNFYNEQIRGKNFKNTEQALKVFGDTVEKSGRQVQQNTEDTQKSTTTITKDYSKVSGYLNVFGGMLQTAGAALTAWALTLEDKSTDKYEKSKTASGAGNLISALGGGLSSGGSAMMMTGNWVVALIAAVVGALPGLVSGISQLVDGSNYEIEERWAAAKEEAEASKNDSIKAKGEANNLQKSITNLKDLEKAQYDSAEAAQAYKDAMNTMADEYPNLISYYDSAGNAIIDVVAAEEALTQARYDAAIAARQAQRDEVETRRLELDKYREAKKISTNFQTYGTISTEDYSGITNKIKEDPVLSGLLIANSTGSSAYQTPEYQQEYQYYFGNDFVDPKTLMKYIMTGDTSGYSEDILIQGLSTSKAGRAAAPTAVGEGFGYTGNQILTLEELANLDSSIQEGSLGSNAGKNFKEIVDDVVEKTGKDIYTLTGLNEDTNWDELTDAQIITAAKKMSEQIDGLITEGEYILNTANENLAAIDFTSTAANEALTHDTEKIEENIGMIGSLGGRMMEIWAEEEKGGQDIDSLINDVNSGYDAQKNAALEEILNSDIEAVSEIYDNVGQYSSIENYKDAIIDSGVELDSALGKALIEHFTDTVGEDKQRIRGGILSSSLDSSSKSALWGLFEKSDYFGELLVDYGDSVMEAVNLIDDYTEKGLQAKAFVLTEAVEGLYTSIGQQDDSVQADLLSIVEDIDWTSASSIESAIDAMEAYDKQNTEVDLSSEISALQDARDNLSFNLATEVQLMTKAIMEGVEGMEKTISSQNKGMGLDDALEAFKTITAQDGFKDMSFDELFTYDATLKQWVYTQEGFGAAIESQTREIENSYKAADDAYNDIIKFNKKIAAITQSGIVSPMSGYGYGFNALPIDSLKDLDIEGFTDEDWNQLYSNLGITGDVFAQEQVQKYLESDRTKTFPEWLNEQVDLAESEKKAMEAIFNAWGGNLINLLSSGLDIEAIMSGTDAGNQKSILTQIFAEKFKQNGYSEEFIEKYAESYAESAYQRIQEGDLGGLEAALGAENITYEMRSAVTTTPGEIAQKAVDELLGSVNSVVSEETKNLLMKTYGSEEALIDAGFTIDENGTLLVGSAEEMLKVVGKIIGDAGTSIAEKNAALGQYYEASQGAPEMKARTSLLSKSEGITVEDLIALGDATGQVIFDLQEEKISMAYEHLFEWNDYTQSFDLKEGVSFQKVFEELGGTLDKGTNEYLEFYSDFVENEISKAETKPKAISDELQSLTDAKVGDEVGVVYLEDALSKVGINIADFLGQYGIAVENGIATIGENTNIYALVSSIANLAESGQIELEESVFELKDTLLELFDSWVEALSSGLSGELSNADAEALKQQFSFLSDMDFTETKNGLKLSRDAAFQLYTELKKIDGIRAGLAFDALAESLAEAGSGYEDVASTMATIAKLNKELANVPVSSERREELERELAVAEEILRVRSQDPDSFNFMDKELPTGMQGPENYWNSVGEAYKVMNESAKSGYMEIQDYVNLVNQMEAMAIAAGQEFSIGGMNAAQLIEKGMSSLKNIDGEGVKVAMEGVGIDFANAATDMGLSFDDGVKEVAKSQIKMLDAAIRILEAMVALEELDIDGSGMLEMDEIFIDADDPGQGFTRGAQEWLRKINLACGDLKIGGKTLEETMLILAKTNPDKFLEFINQMANIDWTLGDANVAAQIESLINTFFPGEIVSMGKSIFDILEIPEDVEETPEKLAKWAESVGLAVGEARALLRNLEYGATISQDSNQYEAIKKSLGLDKNEQLSKDFDKFYKTITEKGLNTREAIQLWEEITISDGPEGTKYLYNGKTYDNLDGVLLARQIEDSEGFTPELSNTSVDSNTGMMTGEMTLGEMKITVSSMENEKPIYYTSDGNYFSTNLNDVINKEYANYLEKCSQEGVTPKSKAELRVEAGLPVSFSFTSSTGGTFNSQDSEFRTAAYNLLQQGTEGIQKAIDAGQNDDGTYTINLGGQKLEFESMPTPAEVESAVSEALGIDSTTFQSVADAVSLAISNANWDKAGEAIATALKKNIGQGESGTEEIEIDELTLKPTGLKVDATGIEPTLSSGEEALSNIPIASLTLTPETLYIDIANKTPQLKEGQTVTIENIPNAKGTVTGSITITNNGAWSAAEGQTSPEITGYTSANGTVETVTINGSSFKVTPIAGAPTNLDGELDPIKSGFVKVEGNYYSVDLSSGTQLNPGMDLSGVTAGSAQVNATKYTVTFTNANGTTSQSVIVKGEAQLNAVLQNATLGNNGGWILSGISAEADVSISAKSENALVNFFDTLVNKLKNIEVTYEEPTPVGPGPDTSTPGYYVSGRDNNSGYITPMGYYSELDASAVEDITAKVDYGTFQDGTFTITEVRADGTQFTTTATLAQIQAGEISFGEGGPTTGSKGESNGGQGTGNDGETIALPPVDTSEAENSVQTAASTMSSDIADAGSSGAASAASAIQKTLDGIKSKTVTINVNYPPSITIGVNYSISVTTTSSGPGTVKGRISSVSAPGLNSYGMNSASGSLAKGNVNGKALASGTHKTLMGELGPELVVSNGRYFVVGQSGAEFVDLADDAIVFNHLQTKKLLGSGSAGHGKPVTNERNATSLATGNAGPAMASASAALAQLRQIRAMWQSMLDASAQDLGSMGGSGGGGGGGGGGGEETAAVLADVEKWYNWLRQIEHIEQHITLLEAQRANIQDGKKYFENLQKELKLLEKQRDIQLDLAEAQKKYYDVRRKALKDSTYGKIFTYDENGLMQYQSTPEGTTDKKDFKGLDILEELNKRDEDGKAVYDAKEQLAYLKSLGFDVETLKVNDDGTKAEKAEDQMQNFWDEVDAWKEELDSLYDSYHGLVVDAEENTEKMNEILQEYIDNQLSVEEKLRQAIEDREQAEIDKLEKEKEVFEEASQAYIDGLSEALSKEQDMYNKNETNEETSRLQRQLAILQRSGGSASEIKSLQDQIDSRLKDAYFQEQQDQIDAIQEASDNQLEKLQTQIDLMTETLEYQKEHGLLWNEVYEMMNQWTPEQMLQFIEQYTKSYQENSKLQNDEDSKETLKELQLYTAKRDQDAIDAAANERNAAWLEYYKSLTQYSEEFKTKHQEAAKKAFDDAYGTGDLAAGKSAADKVFADAKKAEEEAAAQAPAEKEEETFKGFKAKNNTGAHTLYEKNNRSGKRVGSVANGEEVTILGKGTKGIVYVENKAGKKGFMKLASLKVLESGFKFNDLPQYEKGGTIDFTGLAIVHGSKNNPESILSAEHTKLLKNGIFSNSNHSLAATVEAIQELANNIATSGGTAETGINIEHLSVEIQPGVISSDYDARRAGEMALEEMVRIARKTTNRVVSR